MNQFKKAKQKAIESGHQVENIQDLQTAGVKKTTEEPKAELPKAITSEPKPEPQITPAVAATITEEPVVNTPVAEVAEPVKAPSTEAIEPVAEAQIIETVTPVYEEIHPEPVVITPVATPVPVPVRITPEQSIPETIYAAPAPTPVVNAPRPATAKKNVPNIFAPKNEAKSMRKSLVLKPTSVKIAENYCAKNGGSFNELIQTLLDNFIEEYGL